MHARGRATIKLTHAEHGRSRFAVAGDVDPAEWLSAYETFVQADARADVLWDLTDGSLNVLSAADVRDLARRLCDVRERERATGRFAIACPRDVNFGIGRMLVIYAGCADAASPLQVFRDADTAWRWLSGPDAFGCLRTRGEPAA